MVLGVDVTELRLPETLTLLSITIIQHLQHINNSLTLSAITPKFYIIIITFKTHFRPFN